MEVAYFDKINRVVLPFFQTLIFSFTAYFIISKRKKVTLQEILLFCFWLVAAIIFFLLFLMLFLYHFFSFPLEFTYFFLLLIWFFRSILVFLAFLFFLSKISLNNLIKIILASLFGGLIFFAFFSYFKTGQVCIKLGDPYFCSPFEKEGMFFLLIIIFLNFLFFSWAIRTDILKKNITWENFSLVYHYFAFFLFLFFHFARILYFFYFFPRPPIMDLFYFLIPYLVYLAKKEELKIKHEKS